MKKIKKINKPKILFVLLPVVICLFSFSSFSQKQLSLTEIIEISLKNNLKIEADKLNIEASEKQEKSVFELPQMNANFQFGQYNSIEHDKALQLSQSIPFPTYFTAKSALNNAETESNELQLKITEAEIKAQAQSYYYQILYLKNVRKQLLRLDSAFWKYLNAAESRYKNGETNLLEKTTFETRSGQFKLQLKQNEIDEQKAYKSLKILMNMQEDFIINPENYEPISFKNTNNALSVSEHPAIKFSFQKANIIIQNIRIEKAQSLPNITIGYFNQSLIGNQNINGKDVYFDGSKRFTGFNVGLGIPLTFFSNTAKINSLKLKRESVQKQALNESLYRKNELENAYLQYEKSKLQYDYYLQKSLPNSILILKTAQSNFNNGSIGYVEYLQALQLTTDIELTYLQSVNDINQIIIQIEYLTTK